MEVRGVHAERERVPVEEKTDFFLNYFIIEIHAPEQFESSS